MANFLSGLGGDGGIAKMAGQKAGEIVEQTVSGLVKGKQNQEAGKGEKKEEEGGKGFDVGDALSLAGGKKEKEGGAGLNIGNVAGSFFK